MAIISNIVAERQALLPRTGAQVKERCEWKDERRKKPARRG